MPTVNTNSASTFALNKMNQTERDMLTAMERLSSGKRINHAGDDAAGAAIADRMTAQIKGLEQSVRNAGDVISMAQVAEGALDESSDILQRIRELAIQSASDVMNAEERSYLNAEVIQLLAELDRVTRDTTFNEIAVLDGSFADRRFQIGTHEREFAQLSVSSMRIDALGAFKAVSDGTETDTSTNSNKNDNLALNAYAVGDTSETNLIQSESFTIHGILGSSSVTAAEGSTVRDIATSVNAVFDSTGVSAIASSQLKIEAQTLDSTFNGQNSVSFSIQGKNGTSTSISANITLNDSKGSSVLSGLRDSINNYTTTTGITATLSSNASSIILVQNEGYDIKLGDVNFASDTATTGPQRVLLVTSLDNEEVAAGDAVMLGDTNVTTTDADAIFTGTGLTGGVRYIGGPIGGPVVGAANIITLPPTNNIGDVDKIATANALDAVAANSSLSNMVDITQTLNAPVTINGDDDISASKFTITGTDIYGNVQSEVIQSTATHNQTAQSSLVFGTVTDITVDAAVAADVTVGIADAIINQSALITIKSGGSDESDKTFTVTGTDMSGNKLVEIITGPEADKTVTGRRIFKTIHSIVNSAATTGSVDIGLIAADSVIVTGQLELVSSNSFTVLGEDGKGLFELSPGAASLDKLESVHVKTRTSSVNALRVIDRALDRIHMERAKLGALSSRMEKAIDNLSNVALNTSASRGRIQDADFAKESAALTKHQILQQSAMAMIAQAGKIQQNVLQLLQN